MTPLAIKAIFETANTAVEYIPGEGCFCPVCAKFLNKRTRMLITSKPGEIRYCRCPVCGVTTKAIQKYYPEPDYIEPPKKPRKPRKKKTD